MSAKISDLTNKATPVGTDEVEIRSASSSFRSPISAFYARGNHTGTQVVTTIVQGSADDVVKTNTGATALEHGKISNANVDASAAIAYSKLNLTDSVTVADLADGTDGELITWDASGEATTVAVGTSGQVLTSNGAGAAPTFQAPAGGSETGIVTMWVGTEAGVPTGWHICDGQELNRTTYAALFAVIGTTYGVGNGSTTFNVPNFQSSNRFPRGATNDAGRGGTGGSTTHALSTGELASHNHSSPSHTHNYYVKSGTSSPPYPQNIFGSSPPGQNSTLGTSVTINNNGSGTAHENKPPYLDIHFMIKD